MAKYQVKARERDLENLVNHLFKRQISALLIIFGRRGTGKTDFSLLIAEILYYYKIIKHFATNVLIYKSSFPITRISDLETLKEWATTLKGKKLFIFDEVGVSMPRRKPMATLNVKLLQEFQKLRKFKLSILACTVSEKFTDSGLLNPSLLDGYFEKPNFKNPREALYEDLLENLYSELRDIPRTQVLFDTWDSAPFSEKGPEKKPQFNNELYDKFWEYAQGRGVQELWPYYNKFHRELRKLLKVLLKNKADTKHSIVSEESSPNLVKS